MRVTMGNATPHQCVMRDVLDEEGRIVGHEHQGHEPLAHGEPCVYTWDDRGADQHDPEAGGLTHVAAGRPNGKDALIHVLSNDIKHLPDHEAFVSIMSDWPHHSPNPPTWVESSEPDLAAMIGEAFDIPVVTPPDVEMTHHTAAGPPGVAPPEPDPAPEG